MVSQSEVDMLKIRPEFKRRYYIQQDPNGDEGGPGTVQRPERAFPVLHLTT